MTDSERWQQVKGVLYDALERTPAERPAFLHRACLGDPSLRAEVEALLAAYDEAADFFEAPPLLPPDFPEAPDPASPDDPAQMVGPYRLLRLIGRGGMGEVFLGERADGLFDRQVAVKLVRRLDTGAVLPRFEAERRILARLRHPHIARLLDGGTADDGRPYFVMEYVDGKPLTAYANACDLSLEERLNLIGAVGEAVHHAHRNLVVHRDLKPSNILVEEDEGGRPQVKLLDFGIAKLLREDDGGIDLTETGARPMTRAYAAPEQIRGEPVTTATDVYALGVVLYELLTGRRPFEAPSRHALERAILETEPEAPSTAARRPATTDAPDDTATEESPSSVRWAKRLRGDLDVVCLKALSKQPADRYASAEAFVADVRRYLAGLPVEARPPSRSYRLRKFVRRNRAGVAAAALVFMLLLIFSAAMVWQQAETARQRDRAERELAKAETVTDFLMDLFEANRPSETRGDTVTARDLLVRGLERIEALEDQPAVQTRMMDLIGRIYRSLGDYDQAAPLIEQALTERRRHFGNTHEDVAASLTHLANLRADQGRYEDAVELTREALAMRSALFGDRHPAVLESLSHLATQHKHLGDYEEAERRFRETIALQRTLYGPADPRVAYTLNNFGKLLDEMFRYDLAHEQYREALSIYERQYEPDHPEIIYTRSNIGAALYRAERYDEAVREMEDVVALRRRVVGPTHPGVATSLNVLAMALSGQGDHENAAERLGEAADIYREAFGANHPSVATTLYNRARIHHRAGNLDAAEADYRDALALRRDALGPDHARVALIEMYLGRLLFEQGESSDAEERYLRALGVVENRLGADHQATARIREWLVELYETTSRPEAAARYAAPRVEDTAEEATDDAP